MSASKDIKDNDAILKELDKLEYLFHGSSEAPKVVSVKSKSSSIPKSLDGLLAALGDAKRQLASGVSSDVVKDSLGKAVEARKKDMDERLKEVYNSLGRIGKSLDKRFPEALPKYPVLFNTPEATRALNRVVALHFIRNGAFDVAETFIQEANVDTKPNTMDQFIEMHRIVDALRSDDLQPALDWCASHRPFLQKRTSSLEFNLHRSRYIHLLLNSGDAGPALSYARRYFPALYNDHSTKISRLLNAIVFLPAERLASSPYSELLDPSVHEDLETQFSLEYCALLRMSKESPLRSVGDIGGAGALLRIEKGKKVMQDKNTDWGASAELPIEIPVPPEYRYHSIFTCPVSKEQSTEANPPMMLTCGHVLAMESVGKLTRNGGRIKCPYCPTESVAPPLQVYF
ncbi:CTLH/CRA C-terminal to lish motif domain-containing protein [Cantharellus anzutake]|uniref:CTLH/CRA C-terminal to lish motif domain-containing protein n=1 Tax=Cantharellus anzutake TaxID=1750568 RepID=UPI0019084696|nr:CTLH/CRA C-terminal to lish motif domain-containing protein [Cantharellus anzutake]KAF8326027.1 CTLH/CRA C-terminal to lish motif domain-containing protein [Cantharellus anzutake]